MSILLINALSTHIVLGQNHFDYCKNTISLNLRGYTEWEVLQSEICRNTTIDALGSNDFIKSKKIRKVVVFKRRWLENDSLPRRITDILYYDNDGYLQKHDQGFVEKPDGTLKPVYEILYSYDNARHITEKDVRVNVLVDPIDYSELCSAYPRKVIYEYLENQLVKYFIDDEKFWNCEERIHVSHNGLINKIDYYNNEGETIYLSVYYEYQFW